MFALIFIDFANVVNYPQYLARDLEYFLLQKCYLDNVQITIFMKSAVKQRLMDFIKQKGISIREFERTCGLSNGYVSTVVSGIGIDKIQRILDAYPEINPDWLLYGKGDTCVRNNGSTAIVNGDNSTATSTNNSGSVCEERYLSIIEKCQEQLSVCQAQLSDAMQTIKVLTAKI